LNLVGGFKDEFLFSTFSIFSIFSISYMGCHPKPIDSYFSRWLKLPTRNHWIQSNPPCTERPCVELEPWGSRLFFYFTKVSRHRSGTLTEIASLICDGVWAFRLQFLVGCFNKVPHFTHEMMIQIDFHMGSWTTKQEIREACPRVGKCWEYLW
jgi:hypothetical protein